MAILFDTGIGELGKAALGLRMFEVARAGRAREAAAQTAEDLGSKEFFKLGVA